MAKQIEQLNKELIGISRDVTPKDRAACSLYCDVHQNTIKNYLRGEGAKADTAYDILSFLKKRIAQRNKIIA